MLIHAAEVMTEINNAKHHDIHNIGQPTIDFKKLVDWVNDTVDAESDSIPPVYEKHPNIDYYSDTATFRDKHTLQVGDVEISAKKFFLPVGARPNIPSISGLNKTPYLTSKEALRLTKQPKSMIIIGGGYIATELGFFFSALGTQVTFVLRSTFLREMDTEISDLFNQTFSKQVNVVYGVPKSIKYQQEFELLMDDGTRIASDTCLVCTGITPNSDLLNLDKAGVETDERGFIMVNEFLQTSQPHIWAFGDVIGKYAFRHSANFEGEYVFNHVFKNHKEAIDYPPVPYAVFTQPQVAGVGYSEDDLKKAGIDYVVGTNNYSSSAMGMALRSEIGKVKLLFDKQSQELIGAHIIGREASSMIHMLIAYMNKNAVLDDLVKTIYIHPALAENIRNAARNAKSEFEKLV